IASGNSRLTFTPRLKTRPSISQYCLFPPVGLIKHGRNSSASTYSQVFSLSITCASASMVGMAYPPAVEKLTRLPVKRQTRGPCCLSGPEQPEIYPNTRNTSANLLIYLKEGLR